MKTSPSVFIFASAALMLFSQTAHGQTDDLRGRWTIVSVPTGWKKVPGTNVLITDGKVQICLGKIPTSSLAYKLDPATRAVEAIRKVKGKTVVQRGVYRKTGNTLTLSVGAEGKPAPTSPDDSSGGAMHWVFQRAG
jgi:hypothetical protein